MQKTKANPSMKRSFTNHLLFASIGDMRDGKQKSLHQVVTTTNPDILSPLQALFHAAMQKHVGAYLPVPIMTAMEEGLPRL